MDIERPKHLNITVDHDTGYVSMERFEPQPDLAGPFILMAPLGKSEFACVHRSAPELPVPSFHGSPIEYIGTFDDYEMPVDPDAQHKPKAR